MRTISWSKLDKKAQEELLARPVQKTDSQLKGIVTEIIDAVRSSGDQAVRSFTKNFDKVDLVDLKVTAEERDTKIAKVSADNRTAIEVAAKNIAAFHEAQRRPNLVLETMPGVTCKRVTKPIERVGLYVPGGSAPLPSTVLMLGIPSKIAGCQTRVLCTPPQKDGSIDPHILYAAEISGIKDIYKIGGAQAVAAMAYGTETVAKVDKIFGPGNSFVTEAKLQVAMDGAGAMFDMPAGPSEVLVLADASADAEFVAADLLSQAEHGPDSQVLLITDSEELASATQAAVSSQISRLSRAAIAEKALEHSAIIITENIDEAVAISNRYGPEHLIIQTAQSEQLSEKILNAGSVFVGAWTPESVGDYASGTNHVLPTYGYTRSLSGLSLSSFMLEITMQSLTRNGLNDLGPTVARLASIEGLDAHRNAVDLRLKKITATLEEKK